MLVLLLTLACSSHPQPPGPVPPRESAQEPDCNARCMHDNMARPVAGELIEADCARLCAGEQEVHSRGDLDLKLGTRVIAVGTYKRQLHHGFAEPFMGTGIVLRDGTMLWINNGADAAPGFKGQLDTTVRASGRLSRGLEGDPDLWLRDAALVSPTL